MSDYGERLYTAIMAKEEEKKKKKRELDALAEYTKDGQAEKKQKTENDDDDDYILFVNLIPLPHRCPLGDHDCDSDDEDRHCCHEEDHLCECNDIDHGFEWYEMRRSEIGKAGGLLESCHSVEDVRALFRKTNPVCNIRFQKYLASTNPDFLVLPADAVKGCNIVFI